MYKCIHTEFGVDISVSRSSFFHYNDMTHFVTDLGNNHVRISRKIDGIHEIYDTLVTNFTDLDGVPVATTVAELIIYFSTKEGLVKAGAGVLVDGNTISILPGGPATLGGYMVGTGLTVDGAGRLSASASSEVTKILPNEASMLALDAEPLRPYRVIRLDTKRLYYLNAGVSPSVLGNWFEGPSLETTVLSFKGRTGAVNAEYGDYNFDLLPLTDKTTAVSHKLVIDSGKLYIENVSTLQRRQIGFSEDFDLSALQAKITSIEDIVTSPATGLVKKVSDLTTKTAANEQLTLAVNAKVDSTAANTVALDQRVSTLEERPSVTSGVKSFNGRLGDVAPQTGDYITDWISESLTKQFVSPEQKAEWSSKETPAGAQTKANTAQTNAKTYADATFLPRNQRGAVNGVAPLGSDYKIPAEYLPPIPAPVARNWYSVKNTTPYNTWTLNDSGGDQIVYSRHGTTNATKRPIIRLRRRGTTEQFDFETNYVSSTGITRYNINTVTVPTGWEWTIFFNEGGQMNDFDYVFILK